MWEVPCLFYSLDLTWSDPRLFLRFFFATGWR
jgi:hypothetical protein